MFSIFTTAKVIDDFVDNYGSKSGPWHFPLALQRDIHYVGRKEDWCNNPEDPWFIVSSLGYDFIDSSDYITSLEKHPERVLEHPDSLFLLDFDNETAEKLERDFGVICQPTTQIGGIKRIADRRKEWRLRKGRSNTRKSWKDLLGEESDCSPSNAMIIVDRNWFTELDYNTRELFGVEGLYDILNTMLPTQLKCDYHVLIVYESGQHHKSFSCDCEADFITRMEGYLNNTCERLRKYRIIVELLAVERYDNYHYNYNYRSNSNFLETHNRRLIVGANNYRAELTMAPFTQDGPRCTQYITRESLFSDFDIKDSQDLAYTDTTDMLSIIRKILTDTPNRKCSGRIINRLISSS